MVINAKIILLQYIILIFSSYCVGLNRETDKFNPEIQILNPQDWSFFQSIDTSVFITLDIQITVDFDENAILPNLGSSQLCVRVNGSSDSQNPCTPVTTLTGEAREFGAWIHRQGTQWITVHLEADPAALAHGEHAQSASICSAPVVVMVGNDLSSWSPPAHLLTAVLTLTLEDLGRAAVMLATLYHQNFMDLFDKLLIIVPDHEAFALRTLMSGDAFSSVQVLEESTLFPPGVFQASWDSYALQMSLKLLVAQHIKTKFYLTLDADLIATRKSPKIEEIVFGGKANYIPESRSVHPHWWAGSEALLQISMDPQFWEDGFGVTPAVLSTPGSLFVLARLKDVYGEQYNQNWLSAWGKEIWWSEYTLYRLALDDVGLFRHLHDAFNPHYRPLTCFNIWFDGELPWDANSAFQGDGSCLFSVLQSTSGLAPGTISHQIADFFVSH
mmetsp:Transcript_37423/g.48148  ORF Transcript_37423/g.48148 Transcript_37423/m.48148 type:complete len:443 (+) Transcript_37423:54-1382(+)